jgi:hypothetical protein
MAGSLLSLSRKGKAFRRLSARQTRLTKGALYRCISPECVTDLALDSSKRKLSKRVIQPSLEVVISTAIPILLGSGYTAVCQVWTEALENGVQYAAAQLTSSDFGADEVINSLGGLAVSAATTFDYMTLTPRAAQAGRVAAAYITLSLAPGVASFNEAFQLLDPHAGNALYGQTVLASFIRAAFNTMIAQNYGDGVFDMTRQLLINEGTTSEIITRGVIMNMIVNIIYY